MQPVNESIFSSTIRSFFKSFAAIIGVAFAFIPFIFVIGSFTTDSLPETKIQVEYLPDLNKNSRMLPPTTPAILQIDIHGVIGGKKGITAENFELQLIESRKGLFSNDRVKAVLLHINSPGGLVVDSDNIYQYIQRYKKAYNVPVYAYVDGLCASGGFLVGCAADSILCSRSSLIGSVGVLFPTFFNVSEAIKNWGIESKTLTKGKGKDALNPYKPWKEKELESFQVIIDNYYKIFTNIVTENRTKVDPYKLVNEYGAQIFDTEIAEKIGYIDHGNMLYSDALSALIDAAKIDKNAPYQVVRLNIKKSWLPEFLQADSLFSQMKNVFMEKDNYYPISYQYEPNS